MTCRKTYTAILCFHVPVHKIATAKTVVMLPEGTEELSSFENLIHSTATWMSMLVVILKVLSGGLGYGTLQPHCARICTQAELHEVFCFYNYLQIVYCKDGEECSRRNGAKNNYSAMSAREAFRA